MKKILLLLCFTMFLSNFAWSQKLSIEGYLNVNNSLPNSKIEQFPSNTINGSTGYTSVFVNTNQNTLEMQMRQGFTVGSVVNYQFNQRLELLTGLEFSLLRYKQKYMQSSLILSGSSYVPIESVLSDLWTKVRLGYLSVPLELRINLKKKLYFKTGVSLDYLVFVNKRRQELYWSSLNVTRPESTGIQLSSELEEREVIIKEKKNFSEFNATIRTGVGYDFSDRFGVELAYRRQIKNLYKETRSIIEMIFLEFGLRVKLKK